MELPDLDEPRLGGLVYDAMRTLAIVVISLFAARIASADKPACPASITAAATKAVANTSVTSCKPEHEDGVDKFERLRRASTSPPRRPAVSYGIYLGGHPAHGQAPSGSATIHAFCSAGTEPELADVRKMCGRGSRRSSSRRLTHRRHPVRKAACTRE